MASASTFSARPGASSSAADAGTAVGDWKEIVPRAFVAQVLSQEECDKLLGRFKPEDYKSLDEEYHPSYRSGSRVMFDDTVLAKELLDRTLKAIPPLQEGVSVEMGSKHNPVWAAGSSDEGEWKPHSLNYRFRLNKTARGQHFARHSDSMYDLDPPKVKGWMTFLLYLSTMEPADGGRTLFFDKPGKGTNWRTVGVAAKYRPIAGQVLVFDHGILHEGEMVATAGTTPKYVLRTDMEFTRASAPA
jgi:hypothetical protein